MKRITALTFVLMCLGVNAFAAGDLTVTGNATVNGNLGVGTATPTQKLDVNGNIKGTGICIGSNCTSTLHVSGGLYGYCTITSNGEQDNCGTVKSPATCSNAICFCPSGYTLLNLGGGASPGTLSFNACYKN